MSENGKELWSIHTAEEAQWGKAQFDSNGTLYVSDKKNIYGIDTKCGKVKYQYSTPKEINSWSIDEKINIIVIEEEDTWKLYGVRFKEREETAKEMLERDDVRKEVIEGPGFIDIAGIRLDKN